MDQVNITRGQLRELAKQDKDVTVLATNTDARMILVVDTRYIGDEDKRRWLMPNGRERKDG